jgi:hypothetical protein
LALPAVSGIDANLFVFRAGVERCVGLKCRFVEKSSSASE